MAWPGELAGELAAAPTNPQVGSRLVSTSERVRVWHISLKPGERLPFHCHMLDYFWTATSAGTSRTVFPDGRIEDHPCLVGDTDHIRIPSGKPLIHALENVGNSPLSFVTVEFLNSANPPLPLERP